MENITTLSGLQETSPSSRFKVQIPLTEKIVKTVDPIKREVMISAIIAAWECNEHLHLSFDTAWPKDPGAEAHGSFLLHNPNITQRLFDKGVTGIDMKQIKSLSYSGSHPVLLTSVITKKLFRNKSPNQGKHLIGARNNPHAPFYETSSSKIHTYTADPTESLPNKIVVRDGLEIESDKMEAKCLEELLEEFETCRYMAAARTRNYCLIDVRIELTTDGDTEVC